MEYIIIVENDNSLYGSQKRRIMQREKLVNTLCFLAPQYYNGYDMSQCTVMMRYLLPISKEFKTEILRLSNEKYKDEYLKYILPVDTCLTKEFGEIELNLTFTMLDVDDNGNVVQRVRKTDNHLLKITPVPDWDSVIPDEALSALDERIIKLCIDEQISIGDYVLTGGELPAMVLVDAVLRYVPEVLGNKTSTDDESFTDNLLERQYRCQRIASSDSR